MQGLLSRGGTVGVVSPGFAVRPAALRAGVARLGRMGFRVVLGEHVLDRDGYLAGDDEARASDLREMLERPEIDAVWFARGGYGTSRILERFPWRRFRRRPVPLIGYSDVTALLGAVAQRTGQICLHGPFVSELGDPRAYHAASLRTLLAGHPLVLRASRRSVLTPGRACGPLLGGNLTVLAHIQGTPYAPDLRGCVLFLEDVGEECYRIDRALTQLRLAGALRGVAGVLLGRFAVPRRRAFPPDRDLDAVFEEFFGPLGVPVVRGVPAGHGPGKRTLPIGATAEIDTARGSVRFRP